MSGRNSALASLTANYTDSEDEDRSPVPFSESEAGRDESRSVTSQEDNGIQLGVLSGQSRSVDSMESGKGNTLVSYKFDPDMDLIDDHAIDDFPIGLGRDFPPEDELVDEGDDDQRSSADKTRSPAQATSPHVEALETVSSEEEGLSSIKKAVTLPPEPPGKCSAKLQEKFTKMYEQKVRGLLNMNEVIQTKKMFRNPSIYEKLISHLDIDEFGTNYPEHMFNPHEWKEGSFYDELAKVQKTEMDRREKERRDRTKVEFVSGTAKKTLNLPVPPSSGTGSSQSEGELKRKSKWDQRGVMPPLLMTVGPSAAHSTQPPAVNLPATLVNVAATTTTKSKPVTISAFGNLAKKK